MTQHRKKHLNSPEWPKFTINHDNFDGAIPSTRVKSWQKLISLINDGRLYTKEEEYVFRGQRNGSWGLVPSIARFSEFGTYEIQQANKQLENFKYSVRGRTKGAVAEMQNHDLWALGQHYGLWTPLLDWSRSPYVALFFALSESNPKDENPKNYSRVVFMLNKARVEPLLNDFFINPLSSDHERLINQDGLFTLSPPGIDHTEAIIIQTLAEEGIDVDNPEELKKYICKIHIPLEKEQDRLKALDALKRMNIHHASLFPDLTGSSLYCNEMIRPSYLG